MIHKIKFEADDISLLIFRGIGDKPSDGDPYESVSLEVRGVITDIKLIDGEPDEWQVEFPEVRPISWKVDGDGFDYGTNLAHLPEVQKFLGGILEKPIMDLMTLEVDIHNPKELYTI